MTPAVVAQDGVVAGEVALNRKQQAMVLGVGAGVGLLNIGRNTARGGCCPGMLRAAGWCWQCWLPPRSGQARPGMS